MISINYKFLHELRSKVWRRKTIYSIASLLAIVSVSKYVMQKSIDYWIAKKIDQYSMEKYGIHVTSRQIKLYPLQGRIIVHDLLAGKDLLKVGTCKIDVNLISLLSIPRIRNITIQDINLNINHANLSLIKLKKHLRHKTHHKFYLDHLEVINGKANVYEPTLGIPKCNFSFQAVGNGWLANQLRLELKIPKITLSKNNKTFDGKILILSNITDSNLTINKSYLQFNNNKLIGSGNFQYKSRKLDFDANGHLDLSQTQNFFHPIKSNLITASGLLNFDFGISGCLDSLVWEGNARGKNLIINSTVKQTGDMVATISGNGTNAILNKLLWTSKDGVLAAKGKLLSKNGCDINIAASDISLASVASFTKASFLNEVKANVTGRIKIPIKILNKKLVIPTLKQCVFDGTGELLQNSKNVGNLILTIHNGDINGVITNLGFAKLIGWAEVSANIDKHGLGSINGSAELTTDASDVANILAAWNIGKKKQKTEVTPLDMSGKIKVQTIFNWNHKDGFQLNGNGVIDTPRWRMAQADQIRTNISIDKKVLRLTGMELDKGNGKGYGNLWLTWAKLPVGSDQIDMQYRVCDLPIREGLRAADIDSLAIDGNTNGWIRLHGPFKHIKAESQIKFDQANVFNIKIPAASTRLYLDITNSQLKLVDIKIADSVERLDISATPPPNVLNLNGSIDMNLRSKTWIVALNGIVDSNTLGLKGPNFNAAIDAYMDGPFVSPFGPIKIPTGHITFINRNLVKEIKEGEAIKDLEGSVDFSDGKLIAWLGFPDNSNRLFQLHATQTKYDQLDWDSKFKLESKSINISKFIKSFSNNILKNANIELHTNGIWNSDDLRWHGQIKQLEGKFNEFNLVQIYPGQLVGSSHGVDVNIALEGIADTTSFNSNTAHDSDNKIELDKTLLNSANGAPNIHINGRLPLSLTDELSLDMKGSTNLANLKVVLDKIMQPDQHSVLANLLPKGHAIFDIHLSGAVNDALIDGTLRLDDGQVTVSNYPIGASNLNFTAKFCGRDIIIPQDTPLCGTIAQGSILAWGKATWHPRGSLSYDLHTKVDDFQLADVSNCFEFQGDLTANFIGNDQDGGLLSGDIWTKQNMYHTNINLKDFITNKIVGSIKTSPTSESKVDLLSKIAIALSVHTLEPLEIDTNFLKMRWQPTDSLLIAGSIRQPVLKGRLKLLPGGVLNNIFQAGDINFEEGTIDFNSLVPFHPNISLKGRVNIPPYTVTLSLLGSMDSMQLQTSSVPYLRQDQILAILIDPMKAAEVGNEFNSTVDTNIVSDLSKNLFTTLALSDFQERLRSLLKLDRVNLSFQSIAEDQALSITLGKNINIFNRSIPFIFSHKRVGNTVVSSGSLEWRLNNLTIYIGIIDKYNNKKANNDNIENTVIPFVKIHYTWSPK